MLTLQGEAPLPNAGTRTQWTTIEASKPDEPRSLVYRIPIEAVQPRGLTGTTRRRRKSTVFAAKEKLDAEAALEAAAIQPDPQPGSWKKRGFSERLRRLLPFLLHEFADLEGFAEKEIRYGAERSALLPKIRLKRRRRSGERARALAAFPILERVVPRVLSYGEDEQSYHFVFAGYRPQSVHILGRVLETGYRFRLEDLSHFASQGDHVCHALEHLDAGSPCLDPDAILYCPAVDSTYPFKFVACAPPSQDNVLVFMQTLKKLLHKTETVETFRDRFYGEIKLGFEKFGPACATPEFQEVELRLWKLLCEASSRLNIQVGKMCAETDGKKIRYHLEQIHLLHETLDQAADLPGELAAFYRTNFELPFSRLFEHALLGLDELAKKVDTNLKDRPRDLQAVVELVSHVRGIEASSHAENVEWLDSALAAAYEGKDAPPRGQAAWVRRYKETIFTGTDRFDARRFRKG